MYGPHSDSAIETSDDLINIIGVSLRTAHQVCEIMIQLPHQAMPFMLGFRDELGEARDQNLHLTGTVPEWLHGRLMRNGPALFSAGGRRLNHWFDGFAKLHKFDIEPGKVRYSSRFIQSQAYQQSTEQQKLACNMFATSMQMSMWDRIKAVVVPQFSDNTNVNVIPWNDEWHALTETVPVNRICGNTLETGGYVVFDDRLQAQITTAHPLVEPHTGALINLYVSLSAASSYILTSIAPGSLTRKEIARIPVRETGYMHSFAQTRRHVIIVEPPLLLNLPDLIFNNKPYIDCYKWHAGRGLRFIVVDKGDGSHKVFEYSDAFFFHQINAFERNDEIVLDAIVYPDNAIVNCLRLDAVSDGLPLPKVQRFTLNLAAGSVQTEGTASANIELPQINFSRRTEDVRYAYGVGNSSELDIFDKVQKVDLSNGSVNDWCRDSCCYGEPVFVARPGATAEDDGVLLVVELDTNLGKSALAIVNAQNMEEIARANTDDLIPFGFHGTFVSRGRKYDQLGQGEST
jgi:beta,beta-carotene 9',10'-dioxygenase